MANHLQQFYNVTINGVDVTDDVGEVKFIETDDLLTRLEVTLRRGIQYLEVLKFGQPVEMFGGTSDPLNQRQFFKGNIKFLRSTTPDNGLIECRVICIGGKWDRSASSNNQFIYPSINSSRGWASGLSITAEILVDKIVTEEIRLPFGEITVNGITKRALIIQPKITYTTTQPIRQDYMTDWAFLRELSKRLNCKVWVEYNQDKNTDEIFFVDEDLVRQIPGDYGFVYPGRDAEQFSVEGLEPNEIHIRDLSIDEDSDAAQGIVRTVTKYDDNGVARTLFMEYDEEQKKMFYYELDEQKVADLSVEERDRLWNIGAFNIDFETSKKFYRRQEYKSVGSKEFGVVGRPFVGIRLSCTVDGNVNIISKKAYSIRGISSRYSTKDSGTMWYLISAEHVWDNDGYRTMLKFYR